jgi:hypothetical protein
MKNNFWYRYFLVINQLSNAVLGFQFQNFAKLILEEENGRFGNEQMTKYFKALDLQYSDLMSNDAWMVFDELDIEELADISEEQLKEDFENYCNGKLIFDFRNDE